MIWHDEAVGEETGSAVEGASLVRQKSRLQDAPSQQGLSPPRLSET